MTKSERLGENSTKRYRVFSLSFYVTAEAVTYKTRQGA